MLPYLLPRWEMEEGEGKGRRLDGRGEGSEKAGEEGGLRETGAWLTDHHSKVPDTKKVSFVFFFLRETAFCLRSDVTFLYIRSALMQMFVLRIVWWWLDQCGSADSRSLSLSLSLSLHVFVFPLITNNLMHQRVFDMNHWCVLIWILANSFPSWISSQSLLKSLTDNEAH